MDIRELQKHWDAYGKQDPLFAIASWAEKKGNKWDLEEVLQTGVEEVDALMADLERLGLPVGLGRALDFGCGVGRLTQALAKYFGSVDGVDIAPSMIRLAGEINRHGEECRYHLNGENDLRIFPDGCFDFVYTNITLQHMEPRYSRNYIKEFVRVLRPEGILVFQQTAERIAPSAAAAPDRCVLLAPLRRAMRPLKRMWVRKPMMEMYGIPREEMLGFLASLDVRVVDVAENSSGGRSWTSFRYCVAKR